VRRLLPSPGIERTIGLGAVVVAVLAPALFSPFFVSYILTQTLWLGIAAASLIFLSAYGGMVSLAQVALYGIAGFTLGNVVATGESNGLNLGWNPWLGAFLGVVITTLVGLILGALASRSTGIYFLMITLTYAVIANYFFGQVVTFSGFGGISSIYPPDLIGLPEMHPLRLYYAALIVALAVHVLIRYLLRTPFGRVLQGVRDEPVRMSSLGYNVALHRMLAFGVGAFIASLSGVLYVWWNGHVDPTSIGIAATLDLLAIAVIGGLHGLEGAWLGAFAFVLISNYIRQVPFLEHIGIDESRFHTVIGAVFLLIVLASQNGILGCWEVASEVVRRRLGGGGVAPGEARRQG
jgi:branched-chain amino acid transport system permease protein